MEENYGYYDKKRKKKNNNIVIVALICAIIGGIIGSAISYAVIREQAATPTISEEAKKVVINAKDSTTVASAVAEKAMPSVVGITTKGVVETWMGQAQVGGTGSGIVVDKEGYILTNAHVVKLNGQTIEKPSIQLYDGTTVEGHTVWVDSTIDIAIVKIDSKVNLVPAELGDSDSLKIGQSAIAIGNPLDLAFQRSVTQGIISGLNRYVGQVSGGGYMNGLIQTDASINGGNSGGPLLDAEGKVIGINTVKVSTAEGLGFAIPINSVKTILEEVIKTGDYKVVSLGVQTMDMVLAKRYYNLNTNLDAGVLIMEVMKETPADASGLKKSDVILKIGDTKIEGVDSLKAALYKYKVGDTAKLNILRNGKTMDIEVKFNEYSISDDENSQKDNRFMLPDAEQSN
ncbi:serine protease, S1-C subfamily, contains C-terminal PDZ domain [Peptoniphilus asaccharolyticus DSM 20463]|uniref:Serine protease, S1-C subfamily, contains C-terminal PDZ domain n=1 Tax=Peptoniphilus asaccharolyticus DSM 20463 TaxID=573058 RepID=A0A1W1V0X3_PEPAS|nr:trypsin-like peptidase domain-containing protein [Peptoniphilus asaccharolyticus]SMB86664.1 serine protease, S1-C subfamily, contains C-terminal PDZ domain [Peptoniphilus asaccharolyticus DSM 20463]